MAAEIVVAIGEVGAGSERLETLSLSLREELLSAHAESVSGLSLGDAPPGTRAVDVAAAGALLVTVASSVTAISQIIDAVRHWLKRGNPGRTVEVTIGDNHLKVNVEGTSHEAQTQLIAAFLAASAPGDES